MKTLSKKQLDREIERLASRHLIGVPIPILDIPKIFDAATKTYHETIDLQAVEGTIITQIAALRRDGGRS